ncbi:hypothetical protein [Amycolatopsis sp. H20-H5]|uniref:hypothetical protein n=1 Tax=Amycolatopsis sp. H20-H5 TaxID=3046309 RepID=UPI002DBFDE05|nr:hypothetical protein [Amycolatopsis sp. H20-H5]MEC3974372.1 hypothetical protein [Amycolatopsis sp. H20-H5]
MAGTVSGAGSMMLSKVAPAAAVAGAVTVARWLKLTCCGPTLGELGWRTRLTATGYGEHCGCGRRRGQRS